MRRGPGPPRFPPFPAGAAGPSADEDPVDLSAGSLFASLLVSTVGLFLFLYGKKTLRFPQLSSGLVLMIFPYFVPGAG